MTDQQSDWLPIETAPKDRVIEIKGGIGPYGITSWTGRARWGCPVNWHHLSSTWLTDDIDGAVLHLAGYVPTHWRSTEGASA